MLSNSYEAKLTTEYLESLIGNSRALVVGASDSCIRVKELVNGYDVIIAADGAFRCCLDVGVKPHIVVTDLDGLRLEDLRHRDVIYVVLSHGDNMSLVIDYVPKIKGPKVLTVQAPPITSRVRIFGGFTDGDRAAYLAYYFRARKITLVGFNLRGPIGKYSKPHRLNQLALTIKKRKFFWAEKLLNILRSIHGDVSIEC